MFQQPNPNFKEVTDLWYKNSPVGENTIGKFMKEICKKAKLKITYTNHCIRGTMATAMARSGYSLHNIAQVTCHKNIESLKYYLEKPTLDDMEQYSISLFKYAGGDKKKKKKTPSAAQGKANDNDDEDFEEPPRPTCFMYLISERHEKENKDLQLQPKLPHNQVAAPFTNSTNMQILCQNPIGMFMGANLNNCTININMPKE